MPGLNTQIMLTTARARFCSFQIRPPTAVGARPKLRLASAAASTSHSIPGPQRAAHVTRQACPPALFAAASDDTRDIDLQRVCSNAMDAYLSRICDAIGQAHAAWSQHATLVQVRINAAMASGGSLLSAAILGPEIRQRVPRVDPWQRPRSEAIATGVGFCWDNWQRSVSVPGLPWYPSFVAFPGPVAPPTPNVVAPLAVLLQNPVLLNCTQLKNHMLANYSGDNEWPGELFEAVSAGVERAFQFWIPSQMVVNVMGTGPVPTFAPPYVPVGPVVGGIANQIPGAWSA